MNVRLKSMIGALVAGGSLSLALPAIAADETTSPPRAQGAQAQTDASRPGAATIKQVQEALDERGYDVGKPDGKWGQKTQNALRQFQQSQGLQATGRLDPQTAAALGLSEGAIAEAAPGNAVRLSKLIGMPVRNPQGEKLGKIDDAVIDLDGGRVHYAVLSFGGTLGVGDKQFAYPMRTLALAREGDHLLLNLPRERLEKAPGFERGRAPDWEADTRYREDVDRYFGDVVTIEQHPNMQLRWASEVLDADLRDSEGDDIGDVEDVVVGAKDGRVQYVVASFDPGWFERERLATLPMRALQVSTDEDDDLVLRVNQQQIATAPGFERDRWPDLNDRDFRADADRWFTGLDRGGDSAAREREDTRNRTQ